MPKKVKVVTKTDSLDPVFDNLEFTRRADELIGVIKRHYKMIEGVDVTREKTLEVATQIIKGRLK